MVIAIAAFSFLLDFDAADQLIRARAPPKAAWGVALGLTVTWSGSTSRSCAC